MVCCTPPRTSGCGGSRKTGTRQGSLTATRTRWGSRSWPGAFLGAGLRTSRWTPICRPASVSRSADAGETWQTLSLTGEADVHVLHAAHGNVYGWDSGSGRSSPDGAVQHSSDGGATWALRGDVNGEPEALAVGVDDGSEGSHVAVAGQGILACSEGRATSAVRYAD